MGVPPRLSLLIAILSCARIAGGFELHPDSSYVPRTILLDFGARNGDSLIEMTDHVRQHHKPVVGFDVAYAFEARPEYNPIWAGIVKNWTKPMVHFYNYAVWTENTTLTFGLADISSTAVKTADNSKNFAETLTVDALDIDEWLLNNIRPEDFVVVKIDIELAEIPVFRKLLTTGTIRLLDSIFYECHYWALTKQDASIDEARCRKECLKYVAAAPDSQFYFWSRLNHRNGKFEEGFHWLRAYRIEPNDCTTLEDRFVMPAAERWAGLTSHIGRRALGEEA